MPLTLWQVWQVLSAVQVAQAELQSTHLLLRSLGNSPLLQPARQEVRPICR